MARSWRRPTSPRASARIPWPSPPGRGTRIWDASPVIADPTWCSSWARTLRTRPEACAGTACEWRWLVRASALPRLHWRAKWASRRGWAMSELETRLLDRGPSAAAAPKTELPSHKWTMLIDLDKCTGRNSCVVACHVGNNVPIRSEREVIRGHGQHWIRIERYWEGEGEAQRATFLPMLCQQCSNAPCEPVCPVYASVHRESDNLNLQVYNRCVGTRFCGNNCPYRPRQFT